MNLNHSSKKSETTRVIKPKKEAKTTVGITLKPSLLALARKHQLNISRICEQALTSILEYLRTQNKSESSKVLNPCSFQENGAGPVGFEPTFSGSEAQKPTVSAHPLSWFNVRKRFIKYLESIEYNERTAKNLVSYLDKYVSVIREPYDVIALFSKVKSGKRHLVLALRKLFKFYEVLGYDVNRLDGFRKALPKVECGVDVKIPMESEIVDSLKKLKNIPQKYHAIYDLLLDSGLRLTEAIEIINNFNEANLTAINGFYRYKLAMFRGSKQAFYGHFTEHTLKEILKVKDKLNERATSRYLGKHGFVRPKYLRKYAFDKMIELDVPESVADFIQGRVPQRIGAKHYMAMARQSSKFYPRYMKHIEKLRKA